MTDAQAAYYARLRGRKLPPRSAEVRAKISAGKRGKPLSPEHRAKLSAAHRGVRLSREHIAAQTAGKLGLCRSEEVRTRISAGLKNPDPSRATMLSWAAMKARCLNATRSNYRYYGGRGITVCDRWLSSYANFLQDMGPRPQGTTLDRIDGNGHYEPGNCRWATWHEQRINRAGRI